MTDSSAGNRSTTYAVKDQAADVAGEAKEAGSRVASTAKDAASRVTGEARTEAQKLMRQTADEVKTQASSQQQRAASGLRSVGGELRGMAESSQQRGIASDVARQIANRAESAAEWLQARDPSDLVDEVKKFARSRPGAFLAIALGAGLVAGRLVKGMTNSGSQARSDANEPMPPSDMGMRQEVGMEAPTDYRPIGYQEPFDSRGGAL